jgi:hypothetical protein
MMFAGVTIETGMTSETKVWIGIESTSLTSHFARFLGQLGLARSFAAVLGMLLAGSVFMSSARAEACAWNLLDGGSKVGKFSFNDGRWVAWAATDADGSPAKSANSICC